MDVLTTKSRWRVALLALLAVFAWIFFPAPALATESTPPRYDAVLTLHPAGFWPADEGAGDILHDRSGANNHGRIYHAGWSDGLIDFNRGYHWIEIPATPQYLGQAISIGGWVFNNRETYRGFGSESTLLIGFTRDRDIRPGGDNRWSRQALGLFSNRGKIEINAGDDSDLIGSAEAAAELTSGRWQHILFTFSDGTGRLYLDGQLAHHGDIADFDLSEETRLVVGVDAWWRTYPTAVHTLDGSVRDLVLFDRALRPIEVERLVAITMAREIPQTITEDTLWYRALPGGATRAVQISGVTTEEMVLVLEQMLERDAAALRRSSAELRPVLGGALQDWRTRRAAAALLVKLGDPESQAILRDWAPSFVRTVETLSASREERAASALALSEMGTIASDAVPALSQALEQILVTEGERLMRVEDILRNALIRALLDTDRNDPRARKVLGRAYAGPILRSVDMSAGYLDAVRPLFEQGRYMDALDVYRRLPLQEHNDRYFSQGDPARDARDSWGPARAYTPTANYRGYSYRVGTGVVGEGVERVPEEEFEAIAAALAKDYPEAADWRPSNHPHLYRVRITRTDPAGVARDVLLEGDWFIFDGSDEKLRGWSVDVDRDGYVHVTGGMHNVVWPDMFIPGSFEKMGLSRDDRSLEEPDFPLMMYWVSTEPLSIDSFEFVGQRAHPRSVPVPKQNIRGMNYMNFVRDNEGELYLYGRIRPSIQSWGFYRYDPQARRWHALGGLKRGVFDAAKQHDPDWAIARAWGHRAAIERHEGVVFAWALQADFYNFIRDGWGVRFDRTNRMHILMEIRGIDDNARLVDSRVYAFSDDGGDTFHRADGTPLKTPLTVNPAPEHNADVNNHNTRQWWLLWTSLLQDAGYRDRYL